MKLIKPSYKILNQPPGLQGIYEQIELAGRTCYASSHKIQYQENDTCNGFISTTAKDFVDRMIASKHYAMLEHGTVYLKIPIQYIEITDKYGIPTISDTVLKYRNNPYSKVTTCDSKPYYTYVTTNYRVLVENGWLDDLGCLCKPTEFHEKRITVRFTTSNSIMREFTRHRSHSFAVESTRYCNYSKNRFNNEITFIIPSWSELHEGSVSYSSIDSYVEQGSIRNPVIGKDSKYNPSLGFLLSCLFSERTYLEMVESGSKPQEAREVLSLATKCDMVMTGFVSDWKHFFGLRAIGTTGAPHPDAKALAEPLMEELKTRNLI